MIDLNSLNPPQRQAVLNTEGPLLVLAGAGSGKTRVITMRIAYLLEQGVPPERILALTFTNKAAKEMKERVEKMVGVAAEGVTLSTFHALGLRFLREENQAVGLHPGFSIMDEGDQVDAVKRALERLGFDEERFEPRKVHARLSAFKGRLQAPQPKGGELDAVVARLFPLYHQRLRAMNAVDFDDLIVLPVMAMEEKREIRASWSHRFRYIMVDEYQDSNGAQIRMLRAFSEGSGNLCVVGDDDQSIYAWRGAVASNILRFKDQFEGAQLIALTQNYRSTNRILKAANQLIKNNRERHPKRLWSEKGQGALLQYRLLDNDEEEARWVATDLLGHRRHHQLNWKDYAILYRTNAQARVIEDGIRRLHIPYRILGGTRFYDRKEVRDLLAYLRVIANPFDEISYRRIINYPKRGVGDLSIQAIAEEAQRSAQPFWRIVQRPERVSRLKPKVQKTLLLLDARLAEYRRRFAQEPFAGVCRDLLRTFGIFDDLVRSYKQPKQIQHRTENLEEVVSALEAFQRQKPKGILEEYLSEVSLISRPEENEQGDVDQVSLMTLHGSKGLEFPAVYLLGLEEGLMPHKRVIDGDGSVAEERRLAYVGITRAQRWLSLSGASQRLHFGRIQARRPSRFLAELPDELFSGGMSGQRIKLSPEEERAQVLKAFAEMRRNLGED